MSDLHLTPVLHLGQPPGTPDKRLEQYVQRVCAPVLSAVQKAGSVKVGLHITGWLLKWLARNQPAFVRGLTGLVGAGRVEILGGGWTEPFLAALPDVDSQAQLQWQSTLIERWLKRRPQGVWLARRAWDPELPRLLVRAGLRYTFIDDGAFAAAGADTTPGGRYITERAGASLSVFPALADPWAPLEGEGAAAFLHARQDEGAQSVCWVLPLDRMLSAARVAQIAQALAGLHSEAHWIRCLTPAEAADKLPARGPVFLPPWLPDELREIAAPEGLSVCGWEAFAARYDEINALHKRMLLVSQQLTRLRAALRAGRSQRKDLLEGATEALFRAQAAEFYVHGDRAGLYDASMRHLARSDLVRAEAAARLAMGEAAKLGRLRIDYDCDGREEVVIQTADLCACVAPERGGALEFLELWKLPGDVLGALTRRPEPYHESLDRHSGLPALVADEEAGDEEEATDPGAGSGDGAIDPLARSLWYDRGRRLSFTDRFLDSSLTLDNLQRGQMPEIGDFADGRYRVLAVEPHEILDACVVQLTREGHVTVGRQTALVQIAKRFIFHRDMPVIDVRYEISNRYHTPLETLFAIELNLGLDTRFATKAQLATASGKASADRAGCLEGARQLRVRDPRGRFTMSLDIGAKCDVYHFPLECVARTGASLKPAPQGVAVVLVWPMQLWGHEGVDIDLSLNFEVGR